MTTQRLVRLWNPPTVHQRVSQLHRRWPTFELTRKPMAGWEHGLLSRASVAVLWLFVALVGHPLPIACGQLAKEPSGELTTVVRQRLQELGKGAEAGIWVGDSEGKVLFGYQSDVARPTASAIKTAYLMELFASNSDKLDKIPPGLDAILQDTHPAVSHFTPEQRLQIRRELSHASVRRIGRIMMGSDPAANVVYNAAANVATALLGGPKELTERIHGRSEAFRRIAVRRYMLADRKVNGDNTATPEALGSVLLQLSAGKLNNVSAPTINDIHSAILSSEKRHGFTGHHRYKDGSLSSDPRTRVRAGWWRSDETSAAIAYVVMLEQPVANDLSISEADTKLAALTDELTQRVLAGIADRRRTAERDP
jgi:hypothetical protein